jgi:hypothetical protein
MKSSVRERSADAQHAYGSDGCGDGEAYHDSAQKRLQVHVYFFLFAVLGAM